MKNQFAFLPVLFVVLLFTSKLFAQSIQLSDWVAPALQNQQLSPFTSTTYNDIVIIATDAGESTLLPTWFNNLVAGTKLHDFFYASTFGNFNYNFQLLKADETHAFEMPTPYTPPFQGGCEHVHLESNVIAVLQAADNSYNYRCLTFRNRVRFGRLPHTFLFS